MKKVSSCELNGDQTENSPTGSVYQRNACLNVQLH